MYQFDQETQSQPKAAGLFSGHVFPDWNIANNPNGGYLASLAVAALQQAMPQHTDPLSVTVHYLRPGLSDQACEIRVEILRSGRNMSTARASLVQGGKGCLEVLACMGVLEPAPDPRLRLHKPQIPPPEDCVPRSPGAQGVQLPILQRLDIRLDPTEAQAGSVPKAQLTGWLRFRDGREPDALACLLFADAFPPAIFGLLGVVGWVPTVELTVQVRQRPAPGWMLGRFTCNDLSDGKLIEDGVLWDSRGNLVAQSRQLALVRTPV